VVLDQGVKVGQVLVFELYLMIEDRTWIEVIAWAVELVQNVFGLQDEVLQNLSCHHERNLFGLQDEVLQNLSYHHERNLFPLSVSELYNQL